MITSPDLGAVTAQAICFPVTSSATITVIIYTVVMEMMRVSMYVCVYPDIFSV